MSDKVDPQKEGHTKEWQDRARVVLDAKEDAQTEASPKQSPVPEEDNKKAEKKSERSGKEESNRDPAY